MRTKLLAGRRRALIALGALPLARLAGAADQFDIDSKRTGGPYVPTPMVVVEEMLRMAKVGADDFVVDLGSGDGIIVLTAAQKYKARGYGVDIDPELIKLSNNEARKRGIGDRAAFYELDVARADLSKATVVTLYLLPGMMMDLRSKIYGELRPGTRVVSHDYSFGDWQADDQITWDVPEKEKVNGVGRATVYLWIIPAKVAGRWRLNLAGPVPEQYELTLKQTFQNLDGAASGGGAKGVKFTQSRLSGNEISFAIPAGGDRHLFKGRVAGDTLAGTVQMASGKGVVKWTAARMKG